MRPASAKTGFAACVSAGRSQPSLGPFRGHEEHDADENDEANRGIDAGEVVTLGKLVDQLSEAAEIDQKLDADDVDQCEDQPEPDTDKNRRQCRGKQDL